MQEEFRKDLAHLTWDEVYARQVQRAFLVEAWMDALALKAGDRVIDVGCGPGYVSFALADRIGPSGMVYAVDPSAGAIEYLEALRAERGVSNLTTLLADAASVDLAGVLLDAALISMVLHHTENPAAILRNVARLLPAGRLAVIAEFDPNGPCEQGPPREHRVSPAQIGIWCEAAALSLLRTQRQTPEHYMMLVRRAR